MNLNWYDTLNKPPFTPPSYVFAPAWIALYILILASFIIFLRVKTPHNKTAGYVLFSIQILLNFLWSPAFFQWQNMELAFVILLLLLIFLAATISAFYKVSKLSAYLLIPYFLWVCFAGYLNYGFMVMN